MTKTTLPFVTAEQSPRAVEYCVEHSADVAPGTPHIRRIDRLPRCVLDHVEYRTPDGRMSALEGQGQLLDNKCVGKYPIHQC
jgi:hypothetical protein